MTKGTILEIIKVSLRAIRSQLLRTVLTVFIIGIGIMALVSMVTATEAIKANVQGEFSSLGTNTFSIKRKTSQGRRMGMVQREGDPISYQQARDFKRNYEFDGLVSVSAFGSGIATLKKGSTTTNPNVQVLGVDENYLQISDKQLATGRGFLASDLSSSQNLCIIGNDVVTKLFKEYESPIDAEIMIGSYPYVVVGVLESKGSSMGMSQDNQVYITLSNLKKQYGTARTDYNISVLVEDAKDLDMAISEAFGTMRVIRDDVFKSSESFKIDQSNGLVDAMLEGLSGVTVAATIIGLITLFGAGIGLMNIMLVTVTERTKEIGVRKAIGASGKVIRFQFLVESIIIGQIGGAFGIILGIAVGNLVANQLDAPFVMPWFWIIVGSMLCLITSVASGYYPAKRAAALDPIEALRHE
ncbi:MAG: ABC transporter permease [Flavobacteriales bacterium]|nr:ABC transporter permease [Flavobacteriales bacterium]MDG1781888.1 ABC transporter permease [Flavobacteriales bacterium]MDG2246897.1 ABC transporter permease [Flavobacteriales bacterium]